MTISESGTTTKMKKNLSLLRAALSVAAIEMLNPAGGLIALWRSARLMPLKTTLMQDVVNARQSLITAMPSLKRSLRE
jgi:hypothetical protein